MTSPWFPPLDISVTHHHTAFRGVFLKNKPNPVTPLLGIFQRPLLAFSEKSTNSLVHFARLSTPLASLFFPPPSHICPRNTKLLLSPFPVPRWPLPPSCSFSRPVSLCVLYPWAGMPVFSILLGWAHSEIQLVTSFGKPPLTTTLLLSHNRVGQGRFCSYLGTSLLSPH